MSAGRAASQAASISRAVSMSTRLTPTGVGVTPILTRGGAEFVTPMSLAALAGSKVYDHLFSLTDEAEMGHIELSRSADLVVVAPATANLMAKAANGLAGDLASTTLLATDKPVLMAPAMNVRMWEHAATQANVELLKARGVSMIGPDEGEMACGEYGYGRMAEPAAIFDAIMAALAGGAVATTVQTTAAPGPLTGRRALVTAGPTVEPIDPVRVLTNRSSGKQGYAIARALADLGAEVTLVSGPTALDAPPGVARVGVETAEEMLDACRAALPADIAVLTAAVADWRPESTAPSKIKKGAGAPILRLAENPDILAALSKAKDRPAVVVGFAAETDDLEVNARAKLKSKGCDLIVANDVSGGQAVGSDDNTVLLVGRDGSEAWPRASKTEIARKLAAKIAEAFLK
ncbi:MAG: bifunctional phosphopantothenoylcysteine decarboxylase/phosphopantothenate--cysteine ligase CoaBC [Caulobacteraceae bacterium]